MKKLLSRVLPIEIAVLVAILVGCSGLTYNTQVAPEIERGKNVSFSMMAQEHPTVTPPLYDMMLTMLEDELVGKGYQKTTPEKADVKIVLFIRLGDEIDESAYGKTYQEQFDQYKIDTKGTLQIIMFESETGNWLWKGEFSGIAKEEYPGQSEKSKERLEEAVAKMLQEIPQRQ